MKMLIFFMIALASLSLLAMPNTLQSSAGNHGFYIKECTACHEDTIYIPIMTDLSMRGGCYYNAVPAGHGDIPSCMTCHPDSKNLFDPDESHRNAAIEAMGSNLMIHANEACFLCHGNIDINFDFSRPQYIEFDMIATAKQWYILNMTPGPIQKHRTSSPQKDSDQWIIPSETDCRHCHSDIVQDVSSHYYPSSDHPENVQCGYCHGKSTAQHSARSIPCTVCHVVHEGALMSEIPGQPREYQSKICIGCHNKDNYNKKPPSDSGTHFRIGLEPYYDVKRQ